MIKDFRKFNGLENHKYDLCIVGAGAAGITVAREFINKQFRVCLLESGGLNLDQETQSLNVGTFSSPVDHDPLHEGRLRYFGGSTNHWAGFCIPLIKEDFIIRHWIPNSGWPISFADLEPFYIRAQGVCKLGEFDYDHGVWQKLGINPPSINQKKVVLRFWQWPDPLRFGQAYLQELKQAVNVNVFLYANVTNIQINEEHSQVTGINVRSLTGRTDIISAKHYVIACGGIENARLLLVSNSIKHRGIGNEHDVVGRYIMDHLQAQVGITVTRDNWLLPTKDLRINNR